MGQEQAGIGQKPWVAWAEIVLRCDWARVDGDSGGVVARRGVHVGWGQRENECRAAVAKDVGGRALGKVWG